MLLRLQDLEKLNGIDLNGKPQQGFKSKQSTNTAGPQLQSLIARALDSDTFTIMTSLELSLTFNVLNVELLLKKLRYSESQMA